MERPGLSQMLGGGWHGVKAAAEVGKTSRAQVNGCSKRGRTGSHLRFRQTILTTVWRKKQSEETGGRDQ